MKRSSRFFIYLYAFFRQHKWVVLFSILSALLQASLLAPIAYLIQDTFDKAIFNNDFIQVLLNGLGVIIFFVIGNSLALKARWEILNAVKLQIKILRGQLLETFIKLPRATYLQLSPEDLQLKIAVETERQDRLLNALFGVFLPTGIVAIALSLISLIISPFLFFITSFSFVFLFFIQKNLTRKSRRYTHKFHQTYDDFYQGITFLSHKIDLIHTQVAAPH